jgi:hypothetical protein
MSHYRLVPECLKGFVVSEFLIQNRPVGLIHDKYKQAKRKKYSIMTVLFIKGCCGSSVSIVARLQDG